MKNLYFLSLLFFGSVIVNGQNCLCIKVEDDISSDFERPVSIVLDNQKNYCWDKDIVLVKKNGIETEVVPFQIDHNQKNKIWFKHTNEPGVKTTYCFTYNKNLKNASLFNYILDNGDLKLKFGDQSLIHYRYEMKLPPEGVDKLYQKSR